MGVTCMCVTIVCVYVGVCVSASSWYGCYMYVCHIVVGVCVSASSWYGCYMYVCHIVVCVYM